MIFTLNERYEMAFNRNILNEYLEQEYLMPLYKYLKNGIKYTNNTFFTSSEKLVFPFFIYIKNKMPDNEYKQFCYDFNTCKQLKGLIKCFNDTFERIIKCYHIDKNGELKEANEGLYNYVNNNKKALYRILVYNSQLSLYWNSFINFLNSDNGKYFISMNPYVLDANTVLSNPTIKKPQWLIHITRKEDDALNICKNGFNIGINIKDIDKIAFTNIIQNQNKNGKYGFAYNAEDISKNIFKNSMIDYSKEWTFDKNFDQQMWHYAAHYAIMFIAPSIEVFHQTDKQNQNIFNIDTARNFVLLQFNWDKNIEPNELSNDKYKNKKLDGTVKWSVKSNNGKNIYSDKSITNVIKCVIENYNQYKRLFNY